MLLVEDERLVREMLQEELTEAGIAVQAAGSAEAGLEAFEHDDIAPTVLVTDVNLGPGMDGVALFEELQRRKPSIAAIVMTGDELNLERLPHSLRGSCLIKPFDVVRLIVVVRALMSTLRRAA